MVKHTYTPDIQPPLGDSAAHQKLWDELRIELASARLLEGAQDWQG